MKLRFWGTRGSIAKPGPDTVRYGGNTSCVQLESEAGTLLILDCGTGAHDLGQALMAERPGSLQGHILIGHTHWDHIQGIPFFAPLFVPGNEWDFYAPQGFGKSLRETLAGQMQYSYFPITMDALGAEVRYHNLVEGSFQVGDIRVCTRYLNHTALTLGFRITVDGVVIVYACDHEPHARQSAVAPNEIIGQDRDHADFLRNADLVIHDAQYTVEEYPDKIGWGHSTLDYAVAICRSAGVKRLALTHHDPLRNDESVDSVMEAMRSRLGEEPGIEVFAAAEGQVIELKNEDAVSERHEEDRETGSALGSAVAFNGQAILLGMSECREAELIARAVEADTLRLIPCPNADELARRYEAERPDLVLLAEGLLPDGELRACRSIRAVGDDHARQVPIVVVTSRSDAKDQSHAWVTDWLQAPFSTEYARTRIRAWLLRTECRWTRPPVHDSEPERLAALQQLCLLDTEPEERFDRITRLASALFDTPMSSITLIDEDRQWFKSRVGTSETQSSREVSFCAHAIYSTDSLVIPDTLRDYRFADNPVVTGGPRVRFYAGHPLYLPSGHCVGTLCVVDIRPRQPTPERLRRLADLAALAERELTAESREH